MVILHTLTQMYFCKYYVECNDISCSSTNCWNQMDEDESFHHAVQISRQNFVASVCICRTRNYTYLKDTHWEVPCAYLARQ